MRLAAAGITLRHRSEEGSGLWQLKLPHAKGRLELELVGNAKAPPPSMRDLIAGVIGRRALLPVATLETRRRGLRVLGGGVQLADVVMDEVTVAGDGAVLQRFEELEVELIDGDLEELDRIQQALRAAGARDTDDRPKLFQALGLERTRPVPDGPRRQPRSSTWRRCWSRRSARSSPTIRARGWAPTPRICTSTGSPSAGCARCCEQPSRCSTASGPRRCAASSAESDERSAPFATSTCCSSTSRTSARSWSSQDDEAFQRVIGVFEARRSHARAVMLDELRKPAYALLLDRLERELPDPHASGESVPLAEIAGDEHRALVKTMRKLGDDPEDDVLHAARIKVKHARYAAELAQPAVGRPASRYISGAKRLQDILGDHQDATVARAELKGVAKLLDDPEVTDVVKRLRKYEKQRKKDIREAYPRLGRAPGPRRRRLGLGLRLGTAAPAPDQPPRTPARGYERGGATSTSGTQAWMAMASHNPTTANRGTPRSWRRGRPAPPRTG